MNNEIYIIQSLNKHIDKLITNINNRLDKSLEKQRNASENKMSAIDKMFLNSHIKEQQEKLKKLTELKKILLDFIIASEEKYNLPDALFQELTDIAGLLQDDGKELFDLVNNSLRSKNIEKKELIKRLAKEIEKQLKSLKMAEESVMIYNADTYTGKDIPFGMAINNISIKKIANLNNSVFPIKGSKDDNVLPFEDKSFLEDVEEMMQKKAFENDSKTQLVIENFNQIKSSYQNLALANNILSKTGNAIRSLKDITEMNTSKIVTYLEKIEQKARKSMQKEEAFLSKYDFEYIKEQIAKKRLEESEDKNKENQYNAYLDLAIKLEKVKNETPDDIDKINEIQKQMQSVAQGLPNSTLRSALIEAKEKYNAQIISKKADIDYHREMAQEISETHRIAAESLRNAAIQQLKFQGTLQEDYEYQNGDVRIDASIEDKIQKKIAELKSMALLTPEQRGLQALKRKGIIPATAGLSDLSITQLNDIRLGYSDSALGLSDYKKYLLDVKEQTEENPIFKEYLKYRALVQDKSQCISFKEFARQKYDMEISQEEEIITELSGGSR